MNLPEILDHLGLPYIDGAGHKHSREGWVQLDCPWCGTDSLHLGFNKRSGYFHCWKCGGHSARSVLGELGAPPRLVQQFLKARKEQERELEPFRPTHTGKLVEPAGRGPLLSAHKRYLRNRGLDPDEMSRVWDIGGMGIVGRLNWRLYIPIKLNGKTVSWTTRAIGDRVTQRYISASAEEESIPHKDLLYGEDLCYGSIIIVEGPADVWNVGPGAVATFGTTYSTAQVRRMARHRRRTVCFDSDRIAQRRAEGLAEQLAAFPGVTQVIELDAEDPGSATEKELLLLRKAAGLNS